MTQQYQTGIYETALAERTASTNAVLECTSKRVVVVAGPGTGKTFLFQQLLEKRGKDSLVLSFVNALVDELALSLAGMGEVRTLHGFAAKYLNDRGGAKIFPDLPKVIRTDAKVLTDKDIDFEPVFRRLDGDPEAISFYKGRKDYYGRYYGYTDATYSVVKDLERRKARGTLPKYEQILVDEFQDFNEIEVALIDFLAEASPVLIAGDDGQALYARLKGAEAKFLRAKHADDAGGFKSFNLPFCSRCPEVVIAAVNDVEAAARRNGLLRENIEKPYRYFRCSEKDKVGQVNPRILYFQRASNSVVPLITDQLGLIAERERKEFSVLIIVPPKLKRLISKTVQALRRSGFRNVHCPVEKHESKLLDGLKLLLDDKDSNLGWRVCAEALAPTDFETSVKASAGKDPPPFSKLVSDDLRARIKHHRATLNALTKGNDIDPARLTDFLCLVGYELLPTTSQAFKDYLDDDLAARQSAQRDIRDLRITVATVPGSKGLAADYVFLAYFNAEGVGGGATDEDVFNFNVAMTRAKKGLAIISTTAQTPLFVQWIAEERLVKSLMPEYEKKGRKFTSPASVG